jgi:hypothetical protein
MTGNGPRDREVVTHGIDRYAPTSERGTLGVMANDPTRPARRQRAHLIRGTVETIHSSTATRPTHHLDPLCPGFESVETERRETRLFDDVDDLAGDTSGRLCRICTLESVLKTVLKHRKGDRPVFVTFASHVPGRGTPTPSGQARLRRIAKVVRLNVLETVTQGAVAYGNVPERAVDVLGPNVQTYQLPWVRTTPTREHLEYLWMLLGDLDDPAMNLRELRLIWGTARLLAL